MAAKGVGLGLLLVLTVMLFHGATAQLSCTRVMIGLAPCLNYVTGNSSTPSSSCCSKLATVVQSQPQCLCSLLNGGGSSLGITINQTLALSLPTACSVQTPPVSRCNGADGPATSPASSPASSPTSLPADAPSSTDQEIPADAGGMGMGSKTVPATTYGTSSDASIMRTPFQMTVLVLFVVSCASKCHKSFAL